MKHAGNRTLGRRRAYRGKQGVAPGTIAVDPTAEKSKIHVVAYGSKGYDEEIVETLDSIDPFRKKWPTVWVHIQGLGDGAALKSVQARFGLHSLALEDVVNHNQRPKVESYNDHEYVVIQSVLDTPTVTLSQVNLFLGEGFVVTMEEKTGTWTEPVRKRIRDDQTMIRKRGVGYLAYALMDAVVDHFFPILDSYAERLMVLEDAALGNPSQEDISNIHAVNNELMTLRRVLFPLRDVTRHLSEKLVSHVDKEIQLYFRDCNDHVIQLLDEVETDREMARSLVDTCLSTMSNRMNEIMKMLTIISTIFIPLSFIAGVYGMNFDPEKSALNMPELSWSYGYPFALLLMATIAVSLLIYFRHKGWLGSRGRQRLRTRTIGRSPR